ncbi:MAG: c-type cytochrome [Terriglobales bacterium]
MNDRNILSSLRKVFFGDSARSFGTVSAILLLSLVIAPAKNHFSDWRHYQNQYLKFLHTRAEGATLEKHLERGIQQIWIPEQGVTDRCTTCHVGLKEASLQSVSTQPFRKHPVIPHSLTEFGCTVCHRGQGGATSVREAHNTTDAWEQSLIPAKYIESGCGQCHMAPLTGTPHLNEGRTLLAREGCVHCHNISRPDGTKVMPDDDPPSLTHIADKTSREWIFAWLKDPKAYSSTATMPNFGLSDDTARDISAFLISQSTPLPTLYKGKLASQAQADPSAGASLYGQSFCASCHAVQNAAGNMVGGELGPELTKIGTKVKPEWLVAWIHNPGDYDPGTAMPHYRFDDKQIATLAGFLEAKKDNDLLANVHLTEATSEQIAHGKQLVTENGCSSCHEINGVKKPDNFAPDLSRIGSKALAQLVFAPGVEHTLPAYIAAKIDNPRSFGASLKMPKFNVTPRQIDALTTALLSQTDRAQTQKASFRVAAHPDSDYRPAGKAGQLMSDLRCFSCHRINGHGGDMAPDLSWEGTAVQRPWLVQFLKNPETLRPALIRRMPKFNLTDAEISTLTDYMITVYQTPSFDRDEASDSSPALVQQGRELFYGKYNCQSCHIVDAAKDKGYIGPALWSVGARLTPAWIAHYLKDPQSVRPGTIEPNQHMTDAEIKALTAFLSAQKSSGKEMAKK